MGNLNQTFYFRTFRVNFRLEKNDSICNESEARHTHSESFDLGKVSEKGVNGKCPKRRVLGNLLNFALDRGIAAFSNGSNKVQAISTS